MEIVSTPPTKSYEVFDYIRLNQRNGNTDVTAAIRHIDVREFASKIAFYFIGSAGLGIKVGGTTCRVAKYETPSEEMFRKFFENRSDGTIALISAYKESRFVTNVVDPVTLEPTVVDPHIKETWVVKYADLTDVIIDRLKGP